MTRSELQLLLQFLKTFQYSINTQHSTEILNHFHPGSNEYQETSDAILQGN